MKCRECGGKMVDTGHNDLGTRRRVWQCSVCSRMILGTVRQPQLWDHEGLDRRGRE